MTNEEKINLYNKLERQFVNTIEKEVNDSEDIFYEDDQGNLRKFLITRSQKIDNAIEDMKKDIKQANPLFIELLNTMATTIYNYEA